MMQQKFEVCNNDKYIIESIRNSTVYARKLKSGHLPSIYYLISWKDYLEEKNIWKPTLAI